jgi:DNA-binding transcriptional MerR regulator
MNNIANNLVNTRQAITILNVCVKTLHNWEKDGRITSTKTRRGHKLFDLSHVEELKSKVEQGVYAERHRGVPTCHPERPYKASGLCNACYRAARSEIPEVKTRTKESRKRYLAKPEKLELRKSQTKLWQLMRYGITLAQYDEKVSKGCEICSTHDWGHHGPCIDHDHSCCNIKLGCPKCFRGVLCSKCNSMLGHASDDVTRMHNGIKYLEKHRNNKNGDNACIQI